MLVLQEDASAVTAAAASAGSPTGTTASVRRLAWNSRHAGQLAITAGPDGTEVLVVCVPRVSPASVVATALTRPCMCVCLIVWMRVCVCVCVCKQVDLLPLVLQRSEMRATVPPPLVDPRQVEGAQTLAGAALAVTDLVFVATGDRLWTASLDGSVREYILRTTLAAPATAPLAASTTLTAPTHPVTGRTERLARLGLLQLGAPVRPAPIHFARLWLTVTWCMCACVCVSICLPVSVSLSLSLCVRLCVRGLRGGRRCW
jgi:hypothetical protein